MKYDPSFVSSHPILSEEDRLYLRKLSSVYSLERFKSDSRMFEEAAIDFVYTSAKIEGNTYDRLDTDNLIKLGITAGGKQYSDAVMIINLRQAFSGVMIADSETVLDIEYLKSLHKTLMKDLLPLHEQGIVRTSAVSIGASSYTPLNEPSRLSTEMRVVFEEAGRYSDPFERAIYLHCNVAYLQFFRDGNKRSARMMQTASMVKSGVLPLFFDHSLIEKYQKSIVHYYETGDYSKYAEFFKENYALQMSRLRSEFVQSLSEPELIEFTSRIDRLKKEESSEGAAALFISMVKRDESSGASLEDINWPDLERRFIVQAISDGWGAQEAGDVLIEYSPGACSEEKKMSLREDVGYLFKVMQAQQRDGAKKPRV